MQTCLERLLRTDGPEQVDTALAQGSRRFGERCKHLQLHVKAQLARQQPDVVGGDALVGLPRGEHVERWVVTGNHTQA